MAQSGKRVSAWSPTRDRSLAPYPVPSDNKPVCGTRFGCGTGEWGNEADKGSCHWWGDSVGGLGLCWPA
eukprot:366454-Chlamydomonas_euryale.AAC.8